MLHKNKNGHYQIITNPEAEKGIYFLDPECNPAWEQVMRTGDNIMGVVYYMSDTQEAGVCFCLFIFVLVDFFFRMTMNII